MMRLSLFLRSIVTPLRSPPRPLLHHFFCSLAPSAPSSSPALETPALLLLCSCSAPGALLSAPSSSLRPPRSAPSSSPALLLAPVRHLLSDAVQRGYAKYNTQGLARATSNPKFVAAPDEKIVLHYSAIIRSIVNYYSFVHSRSSLWKVTSIYRKSCALTLARKHSLRSAQAAYNKFGPYLKISSKDGDGAVVLFYPESLKTSGKFNVHSPRYS